MVVSHILEDLNNLARSSGGWDSIRLLDTVSKTEETKNSQA